MVPGPINPPGGGKVRGALAPVRPRRGNDCHEGASPPPSGGQVAGAARYRSETAALSCSGESHLGVPFIPFQSSSVNSSSFCFEKSSVPGHEAAVGGGGERYRHSQGWQGPFKAPFSTLPLPALCLSLRGLSPITGSLLNKGGCSGFIKAKGRSAPRPRPLAGTSIRGRLAFLPGGLCSPPGPPAPLGAPPLDSPSGQRGQGHERTEVGGVVLREANFSITRKQLIQFISIQ